MHIKIKGKVYTDPGAPEYMVALGELIAEAVEGGPSGMRALADIIAKSIKVAVDARIVTPLILEEHMLPKGADAKYQTKTDIKAVWIAIGAEARKQEITKNEVVAVCNRIAARPEIDIDDLINGNVGSIRGMITESAKTIRKEIDKRTFTVVDAAIDASMSTAITGGALTGQGLSDVMSLMQDKELKPSIIAMRGKRAVELSNLSGFSDEMINEALWKKGVLGTYAGAMVLNTMAIPDDKNIYVFPEKDEMLGKYPIRSRLKSKITDTGLLYSILSWMNAGQIIINNLKMARLVINT